MKRTRNLAVAAGVAFSLVFFGVARAAQPQPKPSLVGKPAEVRIRPEVSWQEMPTINDKAVRSLDISLIAQGGAAATASAFGDLKIDSIKDEKGQPVKAELDSPAMHGPLAHNMMLLDREGEIENQLIWKHPRDGVRIVLTLQEPPPLKRLSEVRGSFALQTGGTTQEVLHQGPFKSGYHRIEDALLERLGVTISVTRKNPQDPKETGPAPATVSYTPLAPAVAQFVPQSAPVPPSQGTPTGYYKDRDKGPRAMPSTYTPNPTPVAPGIVPQDAPAIAFQEALKAWEGADELDIEVQSGVNPVIHLEVTDSAGKTIPPIHAGISYTDTWMKANPHFKEKLPENIRLRVTVHCDAKEVRVPFVLKNLDIPSEKESGKNRRPELTSTGSDYVSATPTSSTPVVEIERIVETRSNVEMIGGLEVVLKISGAEAARAAGFRCRDVKAVDDTGANLASSDQLSNQLGAFGLFGLSLRLKTPARRATTLKELSGVVEMLLRGRDPQALVTVNGFQGKPRLVVSHPALDAAGAKLTILSKAEFERGTAIFSMGGGNGPGIQIDGPRSAKLWERILEKIVDRVLDALFTGVATTFQPTEDSVIVCAEDPNHRLGEFNFFDSSGQAIPVAGWSQSGDQYVFNFSKKLPENAVMRVMIATPKSIVAVPFALKNLPLP